MAARISISFGTSYFASLSARKDFSSSIPNVLEVVDLETGERVLPIGEKGEICFGGPQVMKGYRKKPEATEEAFRGGRFHTGDIGFLDQDGFFFLYLRFGLLLIIRPGHFGEESS
jgi:acyl-CoA synthetase (AMP-forming)/AMP-acid ligase II